MPNDFVTDAQGWGGTVAVDVAYDYTSPDGKTTTTGRGSFTFTRIKLADYLKRPGLLCSLADLASAVAATPLDKATFLVVQAATGKMPGWVAFFGPQDDQQDAFTTTSPDPLQPGSTVTTRFPCPCDLQMTCALVAPGRRGGAENVERGSFAGINVGYSPAAPGATSTDTATFALELIQPGIAATKQAAAVGQVYRATLPEDVEFLTNWSVKYNGQPYGLAGEIYVGALPGALVNVYTENPVQDGGGLVQGALTIYPRTPFVYDILTPGPTDILTPDDLQYVTNTATDSFASVSGVVVPINDPFQHTTATYPKDDSGLSIDVTF